MFSTSVSKDIEKYIFNLLEKNFDKNGFVEIQKSSFEELIHFIIPRIIENNNKIKIQNGESKFIVKFSNLNIGRPSIITENRDIHYPTPTEARLRNLNYDGAINIDIETKIIGNNELIEKKIHRKICIGKIPIMVGTSKCNLFNKNSHERIKTGECESDKGGYFIIKGHERVIVAQERLNYNIIYVFPPKNNSKYKLVAEIRSQSEKNREFCFNPRKNVKKWEGYRIFNTLYSTRYPCWYYF